MTTELVLGETPTVPMPRHEVVTCALSLKKLANGQTAREVDAIASTDALDAHGQILEQSWILDRYLANPVVLYGHDSFDLPIGKATAVSVQEGRLVARLQFASPEANPRAEQVWQLVQEGILRSVSVAFMPRDVRFEKRDGQEVLVFSNNELTEISVVSIPANPDALLRLRAKALATGTPHAVVESFATVSKETTAPSSHDGDKRMKSLMIELGLAENASETEALKAVKALTARAERAEQGTQKLCSITQHADLGAAIGVAQAWKEDAARAGALEKEIAEMKSAKTSADVDAALDKAVKEMRVMPAEVPSLREQGLKDPGWLKGYLAVKTSVAAQGAFKQPGGDGNPQTRVKNWKEMSPQEKEDLYHSDRVTYEALKAAAKAA